MSSRALRKTQGDSYLKQESDSLDVEEIVLETVSNRYDLLHQQSSSESEVNEDVEDISTASKMKNKRKKKNKKKSIKRFDCQGSNNNNNNSNDEEIILELSNKAKHLTQMPKASATMEMNRMLLNIELKNLNPYNEMRRTFGRKVVDIENKKIKGQRYTIKSTYLVNPKETWPPISNNMISMKISSSHSKNDPVWFYFEHSKSYQNIQATFLSAVERIDSDFLMNIIAKCPYHVGALIQLSELAKMTENYSVASELIERAVFIFEKSLHPSFTLGLGNSRLDYRRQENREFYIVLFKYAQYLEARACCRTALEISKLILSFDPVKDSLAIILIIDYYALRSEQYMWFIRFYNEWDSKRNLSQLPNMVYSYALALYCLFGDSEEANEAIQYALFMFPGVVKPLLKELSVEASKRVMSHTFFNTGVSDSQSPALHQLICLYLCRASIIWRDPNTISWLIINCDRILDRVENGEKIVKQYYLERLRRYVSPPREVLRHIFLSDYKEKVPLAEFIASEKGPILMFDPLPPKESINSYENRTNTNRSSINVNNSSRPVSIFFQSILPSFNLQGNLNDQQNNRQENENDVGNENGAAANQTRMRAIREFRDSFAPILDSIRELLSSARIPREEQEIDIEIDVNGIFDEDNID